MSDKLHGKIPIVIFVHGLYCSSLSPKQRRGSFFKCGFELPGSLLKSFLIGKNGHCDVALPITWSKVTRDDGEEVLVQDHDDYEPSDDSCEYC